MTKDDFVREAFGRGYRNDPENVLEALYEVSAELPAEHPYQKLMEKLREGKAPKEEHADISCMDHPFLVMDEILGAADGYLAEMDDTAAVRNARLTIENYNEPWMRERAHTELEELPQWRAYTALDQDKLDEAGRIAEAMKERGNSEGIQDSSEFAEMTGAMEKFAASKYGAVYGSVLGLKLAANMDLMGKAIEGFLESEKHDPKNPNVTDSLTALRMADPQKADMYEKLINTRSVSRNRISLEELQGDSEKKTEVKREHREKQSPAPHISRQM